MRVTAALLFVGASAMQVDLPKDAVDVQGLKETFRKMAAQKIDQATAEEIETLINSVVQSTTDALRADHTQTQAAIDRKIDDLNTCHAHLEAHYASPERQENLDQKHGHQECRVDHEEKYEDKVFKCERLDEYVRTDIQNAICTAHRPPWHGDDVMEPGHLEYLQCEEAFDAAHYETYMLYHHECQEAERVRAEAQERCDQEQQAWEQGVCSWQGHIKQSCGDYETCYDTQMASFASLREVWQQEEAIYKDQFTALDLIQCYGEIIINQETNPVDVDTHCDGRNPDIAQFDLNYHDGDDAFNHRDGCLNPWHLVGSELLNYGPCTEAWSHDEYSVLATFSNPAPDNMRACTPCVWVDQPI